jgi:hypothetical protein
LSPATALLPRFNPIGCHHAYWLPPRAHIPIWNLLYWLPAIFISFSDSWPMKMGPMRCPETSVNYYHTTPRNPRRAQISLLKIFMRSWSKELEKWQHSALT